MRLKGKVIPQADSLESVVHVVEAVHNGARTDREIGLYLKPDSKEPGRHGRYYRPAAELLGFITNKRNHAELTVRGSEYVNSSGQIRNNLLLTAVLNNQFFQRVTLFLEQNPNGVTRKELIEFVGSITPLSAVTDERRVTTLTNWLNAVSAITKQGRRYILSPTVPERTGLVELQDTADLVFTNPGGFKEYQTAKERISKAKEEVQVLRNEAAVDRADNAHRRLVNLVASRISAVGILPLCNSLIDLFAPIDDQAYIFEMKSLTGTNARSQLRKGISQLYEYRYLHNIPDAILVLVIEKELPNEFAWMQQYLEADRQIRLIWDGKNTLYASQETKNKLSCLWPK